MKPLSYSLIAAALACGFASAQTTAVTTPVGYETLSLATGTNYIGLRLQNPVIAAGTVDTVTPTGLTSNMTDAAVDFTTVLTGGSTTFYIVEFINASGVIQEVTGASVPSANQINFVDDISPFVTAGDSYKIRATATLASIFGAANSAALTVGFSGPGGADIVSVPDGLGGFNNYYYDGDLGTVGKWAKVDAETGFGVEVDGAQIPLVYVDGVVMAMVNPLSLTVSGEVKKEAVAAMVSADGTNYLGSVFPVGSTLKSAFGSPATIATLTPGFSGPGGADTFSLPDGLGGFNNYYFDADLGAAGEWAKVNAETGFGEQIDATTVPMTSGFAFTNVGIGFNLLDSPPAYYSTL